MRKGRDNVPDKREETGVRDGPVLSKPPTNEKPRLHVPQTDRIVFGVTALLTLAFVVWGGVATDSLTDVSSSALSWVMKDGGWGFVLAASGFVVFALWLAFS